MILFLLSACLLFQDPQFITDLDTRPDDDRYDSFVQSDRYLVYGESFRRMTVLDNQTGETRPFFPAGPNIAFAHGFLVWDHVDSQYLFVTYDDLVSHSLNFDFDRVENILTKGEHYIVYYQSGREGTSFQATTGLSPIISLNLPGHDLDSSYLLGDQLWLALRDRENFTTKIMVWNLITGETRNVASGSNFNNFLGQGDGLYFAVQQDKTATLYFVSGTGQVRTVGTITGDSYQAPLFLDDPESLEEGVFLTTEQNGRTQFFQIRNQQLVGEPIATLPEDFNQYQAFIGPSGIYAIAAKNGARYRHVFHINPHTGGVTQAHRELPHGHYATITHTAAGLWFLREYDQTENDKLWFVGPTADSGRVVLEIKALQVRSFPNYRREAVFMAGNDHTGMFLYRSDGSPEGTLRVPGPGSQTRGPDPYETTVAGFQDRIFFNGGLDDEGIVMMTYDGNAQSVYSIENNGSKEAFIHRLGVDHGKLVFAKGTAEFGLEPWIMEEDGPRLFHDLDPGAVDSEIEGMTNHGDRFFIATQAGNRGSFWRVEEETATPIDADEITPLSPQNLTSLGPYLFFGGNRICNGFEPHWTDGESLEFPMIANIAQDITDGPYCYSSSSGPSNFIKHGNHVFFQAYNHSSYDWYRLSLDTPERRFTLSRATVNSLYSPGKLQQDGRLFLAGMLVENGNPGVYEFDAEAGNVYYFSDLLTQADDLADALVLLNRGFIQIHARRDQESGQTFVEAVLTPTGSTSFQTAFSMPASDSAAYSYLARPKIVAVSHDRERFFFTTSVDEAGVELFVSDGTQEGTYLFADIEPGPGPSNPDQFTNIQGRIFFSAVTVENGRELWELREDGVIRLTDVNPGPLSSDPTDLTLADDGLYFTAFNEEIGRGLYRLPMEKINAGSNQTPCAWETNLEADLPDGALGYWQVLRGENALLSDENDPLAFFQGEPGKEYVLRWNLQFADGSIRYDDVLINLGVGEINGTVETLELCSVRTTQISAQAPEAGYGHWEIDPELGSFEDPFQANTTFYPSFTNQTRYELKWVVSGTDCPAYTDTLILDYEFPRRIIALPDVDCGATEVQLEAFLPEGTLGTWTINSGEGGSFSDIHDPQAVFSGVLGGYYYLQWTFEDPECGNFQETIVVYFNDSLADAEVAGPSAARRGQTVTLSVAAEYNALRWSTGETSRSITFSMDHTTRDIWVEIYGEGGCTKRIEHPIRLIQRDNGPVGDRINNPGQQFGRTSVRK